MGITNVILTVKNPYNSKKSIQGEFLVDTGSHYTVIPQKMVKELRLKQSFVKSFSLADGNIVQRPIGSAVVNFEGKELPIPVVIGEKDDSAILGVTTLEAFGLMIDPFKRKLYESKLLLG
jgi:aspartyl protease family protein